MVAETQGKGEGEGEVTRSSTRPKTQDPSQLPKWQTNKTLRAKNEKK